MIGQKNHHQHVLYLHRMVAAVALQHAPLLNFTVHLGETESNQYLVVVAHSSIITVLLFFFLQIFSCRKICISTM